jgi:hypothetical protein
MGGAMVFVFNFLSERRKLAGLNQINSAQARLAMLRINFKSKVKKKSSQFRASFRKQLPKGEVADLAIDELQTLKFETGADFQRYFDLCKKINIFIKADLAASDNSGNSGNPGELLENADGNEDFMSSDFNNELALIRIIKEMTEVTADLNKKIEAYNHLKRVKRVEKVDSLYFISLIDVNRVFDSDSSSSSDSVSKAS